MNRDEVTLYVKRGVLELLDSTFDVARRGGLALSVRAWMGGALLFFAALLVYYLEFVEGIRSLRWLCALVIVGAWNIRVGIMSAVVRDITSRLVVRDAIILAEPTTAQVVSSANLAALGLIGWSAFLATGALFHPLVVAGLLPLLGIRGLIAPVWLGRLGCSADAGLRGFIHSVRDMDGRRGDGALIEFFLALATLAIGANLFGFLYFVFEFARMYLAVDLSLLASFWSLDNTFAFLVVGAFAAMLLEPLRAAWVASLWVDARVRAEGLDLQHAIDRLTAAGNEEPFSNRRVETNDTGKGKPSVAVLGIALVLTVLASRASAQPATNDFDQRVRDKTAHVLSRPEFTEFSEGRSKTLTELLRKFFDWKIKPPDLPDAELPTLPSFSTLPVQIFAGAAIAVLVAIGLYLFWANRRKGGVDAQPEKADTEIDLLHERTPKEYLDEAEILARQGRYREALRALYLATLASLDRQGLIRFDPATTNGQYLRQMPRSSRREHFSSFTRLFDLHWYGHRDATEVEYREARGLAEQISARVEAPT